MQEVQAGTKIGNTDNQQVIKILIQDTCFSLPESIFVFRGIEKSDLDFLRNQSETTPDFSLKNGHSQTRSP